MPETTPQKRALLIGINDYPNEYIRNLQGCVNDMQMMEDLLHERYGFPAQNLHTLADAEATQQGILSALDALIAETGPDDEVVIFYAGHGSRAEDPNDPTGHVESLVPHDSGRITGPNRDIPGVVLDERVRQLNQRTRYVTLLFDCCHSGSVTRDIPDEQITGTREVAPDSRVPEGFQAEELRYRTRGGLNDRSGASGWVDLSRQAVLLAACQADQLAAELRADDAGHPVHHGALSYHLGAALRHARKGATWRELFQVVAPKVTAFNRRQQPQLEGPQDREIFGRAVSEPRPYLPVRERRPDGQVVLGGGAAHGVTQGSIYGLYPPTALQAEGEPLARVEILRAEALVSLARVLPAEGGAAPEQPAPGQRAFLRRSNYPALGVSVFVTPSAERGADVAALRAELERSQLVRPVDDAARADVRLELLAPRAEGEHARYPQLRKLRDWTWVGVGVDGRLAIHTRSAGEGAPGLLRHNLETLARFRGLIELENRDLESSLRGAVTLEVLRGIGGDPLEPAPAEPSSGRPLFEEGDRGEFELHNTSERELFVTVAEFGVDGQIKILFPKDQPSQPLPAGARFRLGRDFFANAFSMPQLAEGLPLRLPERFPWAAEPGEAATGGILTLKVLVTDRQADFRGLAQGPVRSLGDAGLGRAIHPLENLVSALSGGTATRSFAPDPPKVDLRGDWWVVTRELHVRRAAGVTLDGSEAAHALLGEDVLVSAPGVAGTLRVVRGHDARTRSLLDSLPAAGPLGEALQRVGLESLVRAELRDAHPVDPPAGTRSLSTAQAEPALELRLRRLAPGEHAAVLVEESGFLRWVTGTRDETGALRFLLPRPEVPVDDAAGTRSLVGTLGRKLLEVVAWKAVEEIGGALAAAGIARWEARQRPHGVRSYLSAQRQLPGRYRAPDDPRELPAGFTAADWERLAGGRALIFVHGTFSTAEGGFGELDAETLDTLHQRYEGRVAAFDHPTLSCDPRANASWLLEQLPEGLTLDVDLVTHSRGGLVGRAIALADPARLRVRRLVCVGTPNRGTILADVDHLEDLLSVVTNLLSVSPVVGIADTLDLVLEALKAVGAGTVERLPGLLSMNPRGEFLPALVRDEAGAEREVFAIGCAYRPGDDRLASIPGLLRYVQDVLSEQIFGEENDLVVPTEGVGVTVGDSPGFPIPPERRLEVGVDPTGISHTTMFGIAAVRAALCEWLPG